MPIVLNPNRRGFMAAAAAALVAPTLASEKLLGDTASELNLPTRGGPLAILSDTHVCGDVARRHRGVVMADHFRRAVADIANTFDTPGDVIVNGDCAFLKGQAADYETFGKLLSPLIDASHTIHLMMGNHDDRGQCLATLQNIARPSDTVADKQVLHLRHEHVDFYLLDSLDRVNQVAGQLGDVQRQWLDRQLSLSPSRPAIVIGHHDLQCHRGLLERLTGLRDSKQLQMILDKHTRVAAYLYGHNHRWIEGSTDGGRRTINLPTTAYVFDATEPQGWIWATPSPDSTTLELKTIDHNDPRNGEQKTLVHEAVAITSR